MRLLTALLGSAALALTLTAPVAAQTRDKVTLMLNWYVYGEHAPFFLGKEKGYFAQEGIDLQIQEGRGSAATIQAVGAGTVDFGYADVGVMMRATGRGAPVKAVGVMIQSTPAAVISPASRNIKTPKDLIGKTIAITPGDANTPIWPLYLSKVGIEEKQFKTVSGDAQTKLNAVINGQADALLGFITEQGARLPDIMKQPVNILRFADAGLTLVSLGVVAHNDTQKNKADMVKRFMRAATRSAEEAEKSPKEAVDAMLRAFPSAGMPEAQLESLKLSQTLYHTPETKGLRPLRVSRATIDASLDTLVKYGGMDPATRGKAEDYFTLEFLP